MMQIGYTRMCEQTGPRELVRDVVTAEQVGFDFAVISDHYFPWLVEQGHSPYAWSVLGAAVQATERIPLMTYVTCPTFRYHPAVIAQKAATVALLSEGRFTLGLGAGENLNEHVVGGGWPGADTRHERLREAVEIIRALLAGGYVNYRGKHYEVDSAKVWDLPERAPDIGIAVSGGQSCRLAGELADVMIAVEPDGGLGEMFDAAGGAPCGSSVEDVVAACQPFADAGFTHLALVQIGGEQQPAYLRWAEQTLLPALREAFGSPPG